MTNKLLSQVDIGATYGSPYGRSLTLGTLVGSIVSTAITISGIIVLFLFVFGGIMMIAGAGQNNPQKAAQGKSAATAAVVGFLIIFGAYWIVRIVEVVTGVHILQPTNPFP